MPISAGRFCVAVLLLLASAMVAAFGTQVDAQTGAEAYPVVLVLGDSLSAGYGIDSEQGWVRLPQDRFETRGFAYKVVNASISGDTTRGGLARLPTALADTSPSIVIVELGGNDGLRGLALNETQSNLSMIIDTVITHGARVLLVGMRLPPNYGPAYTQRFESIFVELAERHSIALVPFLLEGVALERTLMQADGLHPRASAQPLLLDNVWPHLQALVPPP